MTRSTGRRVVLGVLGTGLAVVAVVTAIHLHGGGSKSDATSSSSVVSNTLRTLQPNVVQSARDLPSTTATFDVRMDNVQGAYDRVAGQTSGSAADPLHFARCIKKYGLTKTGIIGVADVTFNSKAAIAFATTTSDIHRAELIVTDRNCDTSGTGVLLRAGVVRH